MKRTCILLVGLILLSAVPCRATTNLIVRWIQQHTDVSTAKTEPETISFYRGESVRYTVYAKYKNSGVDLSAPGVFLAWYAAPQTNNSILYVCTTGIVVNASNGVCQFDLSSTEGVIPTNTYDSWVAAYRTNTGGATLQLGTMSRSVLKVLGSVYDGTVTNAPVYLNGWATTGSVIVLSNLVVSSYATTGSVMAVSNVVNSTASLVRAYADTQVNGTATLLRAYADSLHAVATGQVAAVSGLVVTATAIAQGAANSNATLKTQYETSSNLLGLVVGSNATLAAQYGGTSNLLDLTTGSGAVTRVIAQGAADTGAVALAQIAAVSNCVDALEGQTNDYIRTNHTGNAVINGTLGLDRGTGARPGPLQLYDWGNGSEGWVDFWISKSRIYNSQVLGGGTNIVAYLSDIPVFAGFGNTGVVTSIAGDAGKVLAAEGVWTNQYTNAVADTQAWHKAATDAQTATGQTATLTVSLTGHTNTTASAGHAGGLGLTAAMIASAGGVTNNGATVNGRAITNGAAITVSSSALTNYFHSSGTNRAIATGGTGKMDFGTITTNFAGSVDAVNDTFSLSTNGLFLLAGYLIFGGDPTPAGRSVTYLYKNGDSLTVVGGSPQASDSAYSAIVWCGWNDSPTNKYELHMFQDSGVSVNGQVNFRVIELW